MDNKQRSVKNLSTILFIFFVVFLCVVLILAAIVTNRSEYAKKLETQEQKIEQNTEEDFSVSQNLDFANGVEFALQNKDSGNNYRFYSYFVFQDYPINSIEVNPLEQNSVEILGETFRATVSLYSKPLPSPSSLIDYSNIINVDPIFDGNGLTRYTSRGAGYFYTNMFNQEFNQNECTYLEMNDTCVNASIKFSKQDNEEIYIQFVCSSNSDVFVCDEIAKNLRIQE